MVAFSQNGINSIRKNGSLCDYLQREMHLSTSERLDWSTYHAIPPDESLLNDKHKFWDFRYGGILIKHLHFAFLNCFF